MVIRGKILNFTYFFYYVYSKFSPMLAEVSRYRKLCPSFLSDVGSSSEQQLIVTFGLMKPFAVFGNTLVIRDPSFPWGA